MGQMFEGMSLAEINRAHAEPAASNESMHGDFMDDFLAGCQAGLHMGIKLAGATMDGRPRGYASAAEIVAGEMDNDTAAKIISVLLLAEKSPDPALRLMSQALLSTWAKAHADRQLDHYMEG